MDVLSAPSRAKINLTLHICGRRTDGFHDLESIVAHIALADEVSIQARSGPAITLECSDPTIPTDDSNLATRAAHLLQQHAAPGRGAHITLTKRIPAGAGLGGGSSNAATVLILLNRLWRLSIERDELAQIGSVLGSDVPLFLSESALNVMRGRGERLEPLAARLDAYVLLALPPFHSPTAAVYRAFASAGRRYERPAARSILLESILSGVHSQTIATDLMQHTFNDLEEAAFSVTPALGRFAAELRAASEMPFCMSGSGAAFFALAPPRSMEIEKGRHHLAGRFPSVRFVATRLVTAP